jgi:hypothetical protein
MHHGAPHDQRARGHPLTSLKARSPSVPSNLIAVRSDKPPFQLITRTAHRLCWRRGAAFVVLDELLTYPGATRRLGASATVAVAAPDRGDVRPGWALDAGRPVAAVYTFRRDRRRSLVSRRHRQHLNYVRDDSAPVYLAWVLNDGTVTGANSIPKVFSDELAETLTDADISTGRHGITAGP